MRSPERDDAIGAELLRLARESIGHGLAHGEPLAVDRYGLPAALAEPGATFVTLRYDGRLRGCCGHLEPDRALAADAAESAYCAAFRDTRFEAVGRDEFSSLAIELSVLSPIEPLQVVDEADLLRQLQPGLDGLVVVADGRRATLLPKVWDLLPEPVRFVAALKEKCGLPADYWSERLGFLRYRATSYAEPGQAGSERSAV